MSEAKCFTRYNNSGNPYVICNKPWSEKDRKTKQPEGPQEPLITPEQFIEKTGKEENIID